MRYRDEDKDQSILNEEIRTELEALDRELIELEGKIVKPSQCYHLDTDPPHVLFNTNCPDELRRKIETILSRYKGSDEDRPS